MRLPRWDIVSRLCLWGTVFALFTGYFVHADELVPPDPWEIIHAAREFGSAEVASDSMRDPQITGEMDGTAYRISFYGCWLGRKCETILFQAELEPGEWPPTRREFEEWNGRALFGRAWMREDGLAALDHPVAMRQGLPKATLLATFEAWRAALDEYQDFLDF